MYRQWVPCERNSSYNFIPIFLKLCTCFLHGLKMSGWPLVREQSGKFDFSSSQGKVREFCKLVRDLGLCCSHMALNTKKVRKKSGNSIILAQNMCCSRYFDFLKYEKSVDFLKVLIFYLARFARLKLWKLVNFRTFFAKKLRVLFVSFVELGRCILVNQ